MTDVPTLTIEVPGATPEILQDCAHNAYDMCRIFASSVRVWTNRDVTNPKSFREKDLADPYRVIPPEEFMARQPMQWLIDGVLPKASFVTIVGPPGSGKSFLALDMLTALQRGAAWTGHKVRRRHQTAYLAAEGVGGARNRYHALTRHLALKPNTDLPGIITGAPDLRDKLAAEKIGNALAAYGVDWLDGLDCLVIDTWAQVMPGGNENTSEDAGAVLQNCALLNRLSGATIVAVMHTPIGDNSRARGWSGVHGAADASIVVVHDVAKGRRSWQVSKQKDGPTSEPRAFSLLPVSIGVSDDGDEIVSCVVEHAGELPARIARIAPHKKLGKYAELVTKLLPEGKEIPLADLLATTIAHDPKLSSSATLKGLRRLMEDGMLLPGAAPKSVRRRPSEQQAGPEGATP